MEIKFYLKDYASPSDCRNAAQAFADKCLAEYISRTGVRAEAWCVLSLNDNHPDFTKRKTLDYYVVHTDDTTRDSALAELLSRQEKNISDLKANNEEPKP